jgi:hypothetical protein
MPRRRCDVGASLGPVAEGVGGGEMGRDFMLRHASSGKQKAETLVFEGDEAGGLLHLQAGLDAAALIFLEPPLEVLDELLAAGAREPLVVAVLDRGGRVLDLGATGVRRVISWSTGGGKGGGGERGSQMAADPSTYLARLGQTGWIV